METKLDYIMNYESMFGCHETINDQIFLKYLLDSNQEISILRL